MGLKAELGAEREGEGVGGGCKRCVWNGCWLVLVPGRQGESAGGNVLTHPCLRFSRVEVCPRGLGILERKRQCNLIRSLWEQESQCKGSRPLSFQPAVY